MTPTTAGSSELRYRRLFEAAHDGILLVDPETRRIVDVNPFLARFLGYTHAEFVGRELFEFGFMKDAPASQAAFRELQATGYIRYEHLPLKTKDGRSVAVEFVSNLYQEGDRQIIQCNIRDIAERKRTMDDLHDAKLDQARRNAELEALVSVRTNELRVSNAQLETFVYSIAHDLRGPLRTMQGFSQLLVQEYSPSLGQQGRDYAQFIDAAAQTMDRLLADLLDFSQISQQKIELVPVPLATVLASALTACDAEIAHAHAQISLTATTAVVLAHHTTLRQVLVNLIGNAVKFVDSGTPRVQIHTEARPGGGVRLWIADNGIGIPTEFQTQIFHVFQRLHTHAYAGTGIGLAIVQKGMERMNGQVGVVSTPGHGSQFWIELHAAPAAPATATPNSP